MNMDFESSPRITLDLVEIKTIWLHMSGFRFSLFALPPCKDYQMTELIKRQEEKATHTSTFHMTCSQRNEWIFCLQTWIQDVLARFVQHNNLL
jgi:hypothetical protein